MVCLMATQSWSEAVHRRIASAIKAARHGRMTAQQLADETQQLGYPISRAQIANYESGRKQSMDVTELLVLAAALRIPPIALLCAGLPDGEAELLPGWHTTAADAMAWVTGEAVDENDEHPPVEVRLVALTRRRNDAQERLDRARAGLFALIKAEKAEAAENVLRKAKFEDEIADLNRQISAIPGAVVTTKRKGTT